MKVTFRGQSETHVAVFKGSDLSLCPPFNNQGWRILGMIGDPTVGEQTYPRLALLEAARKWQDAIEADRQLLPYHYSFEIGIGEMKSRGSGGVGGFRINDWAGEQIEEMGEEGKRFLLARLGDPKAKKHYFTIAQLLLSLFPSRESREAVERLVERESDEELKRLYVVLLATAQKMYPEELV